MRTVGRSFSADIARFLTERIACGQPYFLSSSGCRAEVYDKRRAKVAVRGVGLDVAGAWRWESRGGVGRQAAAQKLSCTSEVFTRAASIRNNDSGAGLVSTDGIDGAFVDAGPTISAGVGVDDVLGITLGNGIYGANRGTGATHRAIVRNYMRHTFYSFILRKMTQNTL